MRPTAILIDTTLLGVFSLIIYVTIRTIIFIKNKKLSLRKEIIYLALTIYIISLIGVTLLPIRIPLNGQVYKIRPSINLNPLNCFHIDSEIPKMIVFKNIFGNLILLTPLGVFLPLIWNEKFKSFKKIINFGFLTSFVIETLQYVEIYLGIGMIGRVSDINDLIFNTISIFFGYIIFITLIQESSNCLKKEL